MHLGVHIEEQGCIGNVHWGIQVHARLNIRDEGKSVHKDCALRSYNNVRNSALKGTWLHTKEGAMHIEGS